MGKLHVTRDENCKRKREEEKREKRGKQIEKRQGKSQRESVIFISFLRDTRYQFGIELHTWVPGKRGLSCIVYKAEEEEKEEGA